MYTLYSALAGVALVLSLPFWLFRMLSQDKYRAGLGERLGRVPDRLRDQQRRPTIWVHAVSVGEILAVGGLISELQQRATSHRIVVSTTTAAGQKLARSRYGGANVFYFPLDFAFAVRPYLRALRPQMIVIAETEFWPNFLRLARQSGARVVVVNARVSDRSWPRYRRFRSLLAEVLQHVSLFLAQSEEDRRRLVEIGAPEERVRVSGNLKFDLKQAAETPFLNSLRAALQRDRVSPIIVCGSTVEGEEPILLGAFNAVREKCPNALMILAPRHPERFTQVADMIAATGVEFVRRSEWDSSQAIGAGLFLLDSIGELASVYTVADIAFVGGSLVRKGGHNILEAAQHGVATVVGPYTENFRDIVSLFRQAGALVVATAGELPQTLLNLLADETRRRGLGARAREILRENAGATTRTILALEMLLGAQSSAAANRVASQISPPVES
jgi:3-deoxy-D-manno-octulosonic-acid transferase